MKKINDKIKVLILALILLIISSVIIFVNGKTYIVKIRNLNLNEISNIDEIKLEIQKDYIASQDEENRKTRDINAELEKKLNWKRGSILKANFCKFTNEGDGCPVLKHEAENDESRCQECQYNKSTQP